MTDSTIVAPFGNYLEEPPLSPTAPPSTRSGEREPALPAPPPVAPRVDPGPPSDDTQLHVFGLLSNEQMAQALREGVANRKSVLTIALERGWITDDDLELGTSEPEPEAELDFAAQETETVTLTTDTEAAVFLRLSNGERILYGRFPNREKATDQARLLSFKMGHDVEWPLIGGRFVRPDTVVSVDVERLDDEG